MRVPRLKNVGPWSSFLLSVLVMITAGSLFTFSSFSEPLRIALKYSAQDINIISSFGNTALYLSCLFIGPFYDYFGPFKSLIVSTLLYSGGYLLMYLTFMRAIPGNVWSMAVYYFFAGCGSSSLYLVVVAVNLVNFTNPTARGITLGVLLLFYGLSATIYSQVFRFLYSSVEKVDTGGFLLFLTLSIFAINGLSTFFIKKHQHSIPSTGEVEKSSDSPFSILKTSSFWLFTLAIIWQQGLTYIGNVSIILRSISILENAKDEFYIANESFIHVTILSVFQSFGRFTFGLISQYDSQIWYFNKRGVFCAIQMVLLIPHLILGFAELDNVRLYICSAIIGLGWGAGGGLFPGLIRGIFGMRFYGTANGFVLCGVPISIFVCNWLFGVIYDTEVERQKGSLPEGTDCLGLSCFRSTFMYASGIQLFTVLLSFGLLLEGYRRVKKDQGHIVFNIQVSAIEEEIVNSNSIARVGDLKETGDFKEMSKCSEMKDTEIKSCNADPSFELSEKQDSLPRHEQKERVCNELDSKDAVVY